MNINEQHCWQLINEYLEKYGIISHQLDAYNDFVTHGIQKIIDTHRVITLTDAEEKTTTITFGSIFIPKPYITESDRRSHPVTPNDCRLRGLTYDVPVFISVKSETYDSHKNLINSQSHDRLPLFRIPVMVRSTLCITSSMNSLSSIKDAYECDMDKGGYFIINGNERVIVSQMRGAYNHIHVLTPSAVERKKYLLKADIRSMSEETGHSVLVQAFLGNDRRSIYFMIPYVESRIPAGILLRAMGISTENLPELLGIDDEEIKMILRHQHYETSLLGDDEESALEYIGTRGSKQHDDNIEYARQLVTIELFPHLGLNTTNEMKGLFVLTILKKLLLTYNKTFEVSNRDAIQHKRIENVSILLYDLIQRLFKGTIDKLMMNPKNDMTVITEQINRKLTTGIHYCFATGKWGVQRNAYIRVGVSQNMNRMSYIGMLSHLRRIVSPIGKEGKNVSIRQVQPSQLGFIDNCETPEGGSAGVVTNLAMTSTISGEISTIQTREVIEREVDILPIENMSQILFFLNGILLGSVDDPEHTVSKLKELRFYKVIHPYTSIVYDPFEFEVRVFTDKGRLIRPLLTAPTSFDSPISLETAERTGLLQMFDAHEIDQLVVGFDATEKANVYELHASLMLGVCSGSIPFPDHSQAPRNCYSSSMMKQGLGVFSTAFQHRADTTSNILCTPQRPLINTAISRAMKMDQMPSGVNCIVAICCYDGSSQEDSLICNRSAVERGLFHSTLYKTHFVEEVRDPRSSSSKLIAIPPHSIRKYGLNYTLLNDYGVIKEGSEVTRNDILVGMITEVSEEGSVKQIDASFYGESGIVDRVHETVTPHGAKMIKIIMRETRIPQIGDKCASLHGQKGTISMMMNSVDMPFTMKDGIIPDLMINAHAMPSRMTLNFLMETIMNKKCALQGELGDCTPFTENSRHGLEKVCQALTQCGYDGQGWETMICGTTGEMMDAKVFIGPTYYQKLKHMVEDKHHARATGKVTTLTRQPTEGRSRAGGLKMGEMEQWAMIAHGSASFLKERLFDMSDPFSMLICDHCGNVLSKKDECRICNKSQITEVNIPFAGKLLFQQLNAMAIKTLYSS